PQIRGELYYRWKHVDLRESCLAVVGQASSLTVREVFGSQKLSVAGRLIYRLWPPREPANADVSIAYTWLQGQPVRDAVRQRDAGAERLSRSRRRGACGPVRDQHLHCHDGRRRQESAA